MEPVVRFCTSADGTRLAYATYGSGPPLLFANTAMISMDAQFAWPEARAFFDALAARMTLVIFDRRGCGASRREVNDISLDAEAQDLTAVADAARLDTFPLFGDAGGGSAVAARFAGTYPERVQRLVLWSPSTNSMYGEVDRERARSFRKDWTCSRRVWAGMIFRDGPVALQRACNRAIKESVSAELAARRFEEQQDLRPLLSAVAQPALVLDRESSAGHRFAMRVAGLLANGEIRFVPGVGITPYPDHEQIIDAALEFLGVGAASAVPSQAAGSGTAIILFADVVDSTALAEQFGNAAFRERSRTLEERIRERIAARAGAAVEGRTLGDGVLATFASAGDAIAAAVECAQVGNDIGLALHLGLHAGDVMREGGNVHGQAVSIASRVSDLSAPNEVLVSGTVRDLARASAGVTFEDRGERDLKGVGEPVRVWAVRGE